MSEERVSPKKALPLLLDAQRGLCARCGIRLVGPGWHPEGLIEFLPAGVTCGCLDCARAAEPEVGPIWAYGEGYGIGQVNHKIPRAAGGPNEMSNFEATCGPCNLAHWHEWKKRNR